MACTPNMAEQWRQCIRSIQQIAINPILIVPLRDLCHCLDNPHRSTDNYCDLWVRDCALFSTLKCIVTFDLPLRELNPGQPCSGPGRKCRPMTAAGRLPTRLNSALIHHMSAQLSVRSVTQWEFPMIEVWFDHNKCQNRNKRLGENLSERLVHSLVSNHPTLTQPVPRWIHLRRLLKHICFHR